MADRRDVLIKQFVAKFNPRDRVKRARKPVKASKPYEPREQALRR